SSAVTQELRRQFPKQPTWIRFANTRKCALWRAKRTLNSSSARIAARFLTRTSFATWRLKKSQMMRKRTAEEDSPSKRPRFAHSWLRMFPLFAEGRGRRAESARDQPRIVES